MLTRPSLSLLLSSLLAVAAGLLTGLGQAPIGLWPATLAGVGLATWLFVDRRPRAAFGHGYLMGLALNTLTVSWISVLGVWVGVALVAFLSLWWGLLGLVVSRLVRLRAWPVLVPAAWVAVEFVSGKVPFGGFSWARLGYTAIDQPMSGYYAWLGLAGVSFLVALVAQALLLAVVKPRWRRRALAGAVAVVLVGGLLNWSPQASPEQQVTVAVVQPNVNRWEHGTASYARSVTANALSETVFALAEARTAGKKLDFLVWPENATDIDPVNDPQTQRIVTRAVQLAQVPIFVGAVTDGPEEDSRQTTSIWWHPDDGPGDSYHKRNLVPFGEWIPFRDVLLPRLPILRQIGRQSIPGEGPGVVDAPTPQHPGLRVGTIICFELAYDETVYEMAQDGPDVVVSQSNINTYAGTFEPHQQLVMNRVRAMEMGREVVVATLNSYSGVVDTRGRVHDVTDDLTAATRVFTVPVRHNVNLAMTLGPWIAWLSCAATAAGLGLALWASRLRWGRQQSREVTS